MKRVFGVLIVLIVLIIGESMTTFDLSEPQISFTVDGKVKKGEKITININCKGSY